MGYAIDNNTKVKVQDEPLDQSFIDSFLDSLLNFDGWIEDHPNSPPCAVIQNPNHLEQMKCSETSMQKEEDLGSLIQQGIGSVCLTSGAEVNAELKQETGDMEVVSDGVAKSVDEENEVKNVVDGCELEDSIEDESSSHSSSSSDDDDDDDDDDDESDLEGLKKVNDEVEMEEGEIRDEVIGCSDDDEDGDTVKGPIRSKNEVKDLPPVPPVTVTIQPHHQMLPVGVVLSIMGSQVVVEGVEDHNPLSEGSILWITENRSPLGVVDEIFGPVKNPYYIVRYNLETEIPSGIQQGSLVSFVPEFAYYVLNNNNLYKKGYDASGENDEELSEELEFSDDEKEAEYKRMMKMAKRGSNGEKNRPMKKDRKSRNRGGNWKNDHQPSPSGPNNGPINGPNSGPMNGPNSGPINGPSNGPTSGPNAFPQGVWPYGFPSIQPQNIAFPPNSFPSSVLPFMQQNFIQQPFQNHGGPNLVPQFNTTLRQIFPHNFVQGVPPNFGAFASWPSSMPQNNFKQSQAAPPMVYPGLPQGVAMPNQLQMENNNVAVRPIVAAAAANSETSQNRNQGTELSNRGGRKPFQRGGGRFRGGRSGPRSR